MKRKLTLLLSAVMAASSLPMTAYAANFKDINDVPWATTVINNVADKGLLSGYEDNTFRGKNNVTYCEAMQMVYTTLTKSGAGQPIDAVTAYSYMNVLATYNVPNWARMAVAYGLSNGIIDMEMVVTNFAGGTKAATREDVAVMFGNAVGSIYGKERDTSGAKTFADYWGISANALEQVSMLKNMGIISGDNYNRFNPKNNITRAEMAVMLSNTYDVVTNGIAEKGKLIEIQKNGDNYYFRIQKESGGTESFPATEGEIPVYVGYTTETIAMSKLMEDDEVEFVFSGANLIAIRQLGTTGVQGKYDVTGYVTALKDNVMSIQNENTGDTDKYNIRNGADITVDGEEVSLSELRDILDERYKEYAYAGLSVRTERERVGVGQYKDVYYIEKIEITFTTEYVTAGEVTAISEKSISVKQTEGGVESAFLFMEDCEFYIGEEKADIDAAKELAKTGTIYVKVTANESDKAVKIVLAEDTFDDTFDTVENRTYTVYSLNDKKMVLEAGGKKYTYEFKDSEHSLDNITFYTWSSDDEEWNKVKGVGNAENYVGDEDGKVYAMVTFNKGNKLKEVYLADRKSAWDDEDNQTERKGTVASIVDNMLKFKTSSVEYKLLNKYEDGDLQVRGVETQSKTVLTRMANDSDAELYAEITANNDKEAIKIVARLTKIVGELVEWDRDEKIIEILTEDGNTFKLKTQKSPKLTDEEEDVFDLDDIDGTKYKGEKVELGFNTSGVVDTFTFENGRKSNDVTTIVKGIATAAADGLQVEGNSKTYAWLSRNNVEIKNYSSPSESLDTIKKMIDDPDVEVYVEAALDDKDRVETIKIYVRSAEGELTEYEDNGNVRIKTDAGNKFSFIPNNVLDKCDVNDWDQEDLQLYGKGVGYGVLLTFDKDGDVCGIEDR